MSVPAADPLLRAVIENPNDIGRRLVYADCLQEQGDPRGEFIVAHIQQRPRAAELLRAHGHAWTAFMRPAVTRGYRFVNGFIERVTFRGKYIAQLPRIAHQTPLRGLRMREMAHFAPELRAVAEVTRRIEVLNLTSAGLTPRTFQQITLASWPILTELWAARNRLDAPTLAGLRQLPRLSSLLLSGTGLDDEALPHLSILPSLREVDLRGNHFSDHALAAFLGQTPHIRVLGLPVLGPASTEALLRRDEATLALVFTEGTEQRSLLDSLCAALGTRFHPQATDTGRRMGRHRGVPLPRPQPTPFDRPWP